LASITDVMISLNYRTLISLAHCS